jgi:hypothetical protein
VAITPDKAIRQLDSASRKLERVRKCLIGCEPPEAQVMPLLQQIIETLKGLQSERELLSGHDSIQQLLTGIQERTARVELLIDSAAHACCSSALEQPLIEGSYAPDGSVPLLQFGGRMVIHI